ncbi:hypothetical protein GZH47_15875 [Paenibacillus rhizovicinus]|uniref:Uncharacterized protein n=1 Tax=Paenibacillus rhizovicinus TaxID=2704463 RepID=A0A6C0P0Y1_9BACL|nr:hypothetical protein [Paenibacillus rhizovicinus]QHW32135.1 hypothetical protein GZH47_15875 [Paenibacillus rhizovicinus]
MILIQLMRNAFTNRSKKTAAKNNGAAVERGAVPAVERGTVPAAPMGQVIQLDRRKLRQRRERDVQQRKLDEGLRATVPANQAEREQMANADKHKPRASEAPKREPVLGKRQEMTGIYRLKLAADPPHHKHIADKPQNIPIPDALRPKQMSDVQQPKQMSDARHRKRATDNAQHPERAPAILRDQ